MKSNVLKIVEYRPFYDSFIKRQEKGEVLNFDDLTKRELFHLNVVERITDKQLGEMFNISKDKVTRRRDKYNYSKWFNTRGNIVLEEIEQYTVEQAQKHKNDETRELCHRVLEALHPEFNERI